MLLPKGGVTWKSARARLPPYQAVFRFIFRTRILLLIAITGLSIFLWQGLRGTAGEMQRCVGDKGDWIEELC